MRETEPVVDDRNDEEEDLLSEHSDHTSNTSFYGDNATSNRNNARYTLRVLCKYWSIIIKVFFSAAHPVVRNGSGNEPTIS